MRTSLPAAAALALALGACGADRAVTGSTVVPADHRERHPMVLTEAPRTLDVFVTAPGGLDGRQREDVRAFAGEYGRHGRSGMIAQVPVGTPDDGAVHRALGDVRASLDGAGLGAVPLSVSTYPVADPAVAAPIRLSFHRLQAKVASQCGLWPQDLGASDAIFSNSNRPYYNHGCAVQSNVAAQVADPVDLVRGRTEGRIDTVRRANNIDKLREGKDPSTEYRQDNQNKINQTVAQ